MRTYWFKQYHSRMFFFFPLLFHYSCFFVCSSDLCCLMSLHLHQILHQDIHFLIWEAHYMYVSTWGRNFQSNSLFLVTVFCFSCPMTYVLFLKKFKKYLEREKQESVVVCCMNIQSPFEFRNRIKTAAYETQIV